MGLWDEFKKAVVAGESLMMLLGEALHVCPCQGMKHLCDTDESFLLSGGQGLHLFEAEKQSLEELYCCSMAKEQALPRVWSSH